MTTKASWEEHQALKKTERRLAFLQRLDELAQRIHATENIDDIMLEISRDICALFGCDRLTLYTVSADRTAIQSKIKVGMDSFKNFALPITNSSIAGHVALTKRAFNIHDVYDDDELRRHARELRFLDKVDKRTGYRSREMVAAPILNAGTGELLGVLQFINNRMGGPFSALVEEGAQELCKTLASVFEQQLAQPVAIHTRFDPLVLLGALAQPELELAKRTARRKQLDLEDVLLDEFQVKTEALGAAYAQFFGATYEPFRGDRQQPRLLQGIKREYVEHNGWLIAGEEDRMLTVMALDPDRLRASRTVESLFPGYGVDLRVTTRREFLQTVDQLYGAAATATDTRRPEDIALDRIHHLVRDALATAPELQAVLQTDYSQVVRLGAAEYATDGQITLRIAVKLS